MARRQPKSKTPGQHTAVKASDVTAPLTLTKLDGTPLEVIKDPEPPIKTIFDFVHSKVETTPTQPPIPDFMRCKVCGEKLHKKAASVCYGCWHRMPKGWRMLLTRASETKRKDVFDWLCGEYAMTAYGGNRKGNG